VIEPLLKRLEHFLWTPPGGSESTLLRALRIPLRYLYALVRDLLEGQLTLRAMSLVYTTLLSLVPLLAFSFSVLKGFGVHRQIQPLLYEFLAPLGEKGADITDQVIAFVDNVKGGVLGGGDERLVHLELRLQLLDLLRRDEGRIRLPDLLLALEVALGLQLVRAGLRETRARVRQARLGALHRGLILLGIDLEQELALSDEVPLLHREPGDLPGDLRGEVDLLLRGDLAAGGHRRDEILVRHRLDPHLGGRVASLE
jgi:hypothetical protein